MIAGTLAVWRKNIVERIRSDVLRRNLKVKNDFDKVLVIEFEREHGYDVTSKSGSIKPCCVKKDLYTHRDSSRLARNIKVQIIILSYTFFYTRKSDDKWRDQAELGVVPYGAIPYIYLYVW
jgi:hypothetical protein